MIVRGKLLFSVFAAALLVSGCVSAPVRQTVKETPVVEQPRETPKETPKENPVEKPKDPVVEKPPVEKPPEEKPPAEFVVTEDLYRKTFGEIEQLINTLNEIVKEKNFKGWVNYLSSEYALRSGSAEFLAESSQSVVLKKSGITLRSLQDYFLYVVVPSRSQAKLDDISFVDETHVKAITIINGKPVILYWLVKAEGQWKIGIW
jgi:hypothetical protein